MTGRKSKVTPKIETEFPVDLSAAFPRPGTLAFKTALALNWKETQLDLKGKSTSSLLWTAFRRHNNGPERFGIFVLWICLCIDRPWEKGWRFRVSEKLLSQAEDIILKFKLEGCRDLPDPSTVWKRLSRADAKKKIMDAAIGLPGESVLDLLRWSSPNLALPAFPTWRQVFGQKRVRDTARFVWLTRQPISKRDLMRRLRLTSSEVDSLIKWAGPRLKLEDRGRGSVWIRRA